MKKEINVLVTGSSKGIGKSVAKILLNEGYNVILTGRNPERLKKTALEINAKGYFVCDLVEPNAPKKLLNEIISKHEKVDVLINNAGEYAWSPIEKTSDETVSRIIKLNTTVPYQLIKETVPCMKKRGWGRIVNIGSISGVVGEANASLYSMTKSAFFGLTKALALELAQDNITVNTINPGWVETELAQEACLEGEFSKEENLEIIPQKRFISPDEIGHLVSYLICENAKGLTGQSISLCAGLSAG